MNAYSVWPIDRPHWATTINASSIGRAKSEYFRNLLDAWPDYQYCELRAKKIGAPQTDDRFLSCARYRGVPELRCGMRIRTGNREGIVVGHDASANFIVEFNDGRRGSVHVGEMTILDTTPVKCNPSTVNE
jgi:hypothetical protein